MSKLALIKPFLEIMWANIKYLLIGRHLPNKKRTTKSKYMRREKKVNLVWALLTLIPVFTIILTIFIGNGTIRIGKSSPVEQELTGRDVIQQQSEQYYEMYQEMSKKMIGFTERMSEVLNTNNELVSEAERAKLALEQEKELRVKAEIENAALMAKVDALEQKAADQIAENKKLMSEMADLRESYAREIEDNRKLRDELLASKFQTPPPPPVVTPPPSHYSDNSSIRAAKRRVILNGIQDLKEGRF